MASCRVEQIRFAGLCCGAGEQNQTGSLAGGVIIDPQGLLETHYADSRMASLTQFIAVHAQHERQHLPVAEVPGDA